MESINEKNEINLELLKLLGLTGTEVKVFFQILVSKSAVPLEISELSGIPKSKIYGIFKSLTEKGFLQKSSQGYQFKPDVLNKIKNNFEQTFKGFNKFLEKVIETYPTAPDIVVDKINAMFEELGYDIETNDRLDEKIFDGRSSRYAPFQRFAKNIGPSWIIIASSPTSGQKAGVFITTPDFTRTLRKAEGPFFLREFVYQYGVDNSFVIGSESVRIPGSSKNNFRFFNILSDYDLEIKKILENFDRSWQQTRETLNRLETRIEEPYKTISMATIFLGSLRYSVKDVATSTETWMYKSFEEIIDRIDVDLKTNTDVYLRIKFEFKKLYNEHRQSKIIPTEEQIAHLRNQISDLEEDLSRLDEERGKLFDEIDSMSRSDIHKKEGFVVNPFVFTIPVENHLDMIGQKSAILKLTKFVDEVSQNDISKNVTFIVDNPGMGKTHLMKYILDKMNTEKNSHSLGIYIRCKPGNDLLGIYSQLQSGVSQLPKSNLKNVLQAILSEKTQFYTMNELIELLRRLSHHTYQNEKKGFFLFLDEFENLIPTSSESKTVLLQLRNLIQTQHVGFVIVLREDYWEKNKISGEIIPSNLYEILKMDRFDEQHTELLLNKRLEMFSRFHPPKIHFDKNAIQFIVKQANGNIRRTITLARDGFRNCINKNLNVVTESLLIDERQQTLDGIIE